MHFYLFFFENFCNLKDAVAPISAVPNSFQSSQYATSKSDTHGTTEQTTTTETRRVTQSTMRLEHKSPYPDLEVPNYTPRALTPSLLPNYDRSPAPFVSPDKSASQQQSYARNITNISSSNSYRNSGLDYPTAPVDPPKYAKFDHSKTPQAQAIFYNPNKTNDNDNFTYHQREEFKKLNLIPGPQPEFGCMPKSDEENKKECISDRIKKLESSYKEVSDAPQGGVKILPFGMNQSTTQQQSYSSTLVKQINNIPSLSKPSAFNGYATPSPRPATSTDEDDHGELKRQSIKETAKAFDHKISEYKSSGNDYQLKAPGLVRTIFPTATPRQRPKSFHELPVGLSANLNLLTPEPEPEMLFAPRPAFQRNSSLVETIEQSLEKDWEKPQSRVIPGAVRMMPPSPLHHVPDSISNAPVKPWAPKPTSGYAADTEDSAYRTSSRTETYESHSNRQCFEKVGTILCVFLFVCLL